MADPVTLLAIGSIATTALGAGVSAMGSIQQGQATAASQRYQAQVAQNNAQIAEQSARYTAAAGRERAFQNDLQTRAVLGQEEAAQGASGIDLTTGSPSDVRESTRTLGRLGSLNIMNNAALQQYGYASQATSFRAQSGLDIATAQSAEAAGRTGAFTSLLGGASSVSNKWLGYQLQGVPGFSLGTGGLY